MTRAGAARSETKTEPSGARLVAEPQAGHAWGASATDYYLYDGLGCVMALGNASFSITQTLEYDVWGSQRAGQGSSSNALKYVGSLGHPSDADTGLIYMRARYFDPDVGRFVSEDPGRHAVNWFVYCDGDPVGACDPDGRITQKQIDFRVQMLLGLGTGLVGGGLVLAAIGAITWYGGGVAEGGPKSFGSLTAAATFGVGAGAVVLGASLIAAASYMNGMTPDEYEEEQALIESMLGAAFYFGRAPSD